MIMTGKSFQKKAPEMTNDRYADSGLHYLPIEWIDEPEFSCCKDGRWVLVITGPLLGSSCIAVHWDNSTEEWMDCWNGYEYKQHDLVLFFPASLDPIRK